MTLVFCTTLLLPVKLAKSKYSAKQHPTANSLFFHGLVFFSFEGDSQMKTLLHMPYSVKMLVKMSLKGEVEGVKKYPKL